MKRAVDRFLALPPLPKAMLAGVIAGLAIGLGAAALEVTGVVRSVPATTIGLVAGLAVAFLVRQQDMPRYEIPAEGWGSVPPTGATVVRTYRGNPSEAAALYEQDAAEMARYGYSPTSQVYAQGSWGCGAFLIALLLAFVLIGILIFIYLIVVKPAGTLTVTYALTRAKAPLT